MKAKWTFMVYMAGDNTLSTAVDADLKEMRVVGSTPEVNIVAQADNAGNRGTRRYLIQKNGVNETVIKMDETDSGSPAVLNDFILWAATAYPADHYGLILWSHGNGWQPTELDRIARSVNSPRYNSRELTPRSASHFGKTLFRTTWEKVFQLPTAELRAICVDDGTGHSLDTIELGNVLNAARQVLGQPIDLLGMDACLMSNLEVAYQAKPYVLYLVASEETEPGDGWPYDVVLEKLTGNPDIPTKELAACIVGSYVKSYKDINYPDPVTQAALDLSRSELVTAPLDALAGILLDKMKSLRSKMREAQFDSSSFNNYTLWDIADFFAKLAKRSRDKKLRQAVEELKAALTPGPDGFIISEDHNGSAVKNCKGLSIYLPLMTKVSPYYDELDYSINHRWMEMLKAYKK